MSRVQFVETVAVPLGVGGSLLPVQGIAAIPYIVDANGNEGGQANAYQSRTGLVAAPSLNTDSTGTVSYWLDAGDYNIHFSDPLSSPRIASYVRGFTAPVIDTNQIVVASQNLIQFTGDHKHSWQTVDHGLKADGSFEWLLITNDPDGGGRQVDATVYASLRAQIGNPPITAGKFRLPNVSGRGLIAAGAASGLTARHVGDLIGAETHIHPISAISIPTMAFSASNPGAISVAVLVAPHNHGLSGNGFAQIGFGQAGPNSAIEVGQLAGSFGSFDRWWAGWGLWSFDAPGGIGPYNGVALGGVTEPTQPAGSGSIGAGGVSVSGSIAGAATTPTNTQSGTQTSMQPGFGMNLFIKT